MKLPKGVKKTLDLMAMPFAEIGSNNGSNKNPADVAATQKGMLFALIILSALIIIIGGYAVVESLYPTVKHVDDKTETIVIGKIFLLWGIFLTLLPAPYMFIKLFLAPHSYPDKLVVTRRRNPVAVYDRPDYRFFLRPFYSWRIINGKIIDIDTGRIDVEMKFGEKRIKTPVQFSASFQLDNREEVEIVIDEISKETKMEKPAILAMHFGSDTELYEYFVEELIGQGSKLLSEYSSPAAAFQSYKEIEEKFKIALTEQAQKFGYRVVDHNLRIFPDRVDIKADAIIIQGKAQAEVARAYNESLKGNWPATAAVIATEVATPIIEAVVKKMLGKTKNVGRTIEKVGSTIRKISESDEEVRS